MSTIYVDVNAQNSKIETTDNNIYTYTLPQTVELPTGTEINVMNSLINLQGITGSSIEINETIEDSLLCQYYMLDSSYDIPNRNVGTALSQLGSFNIYSSMIQRLNNIDADPVYQALVNTNDVGFTENIMPIVVDTDVGGKTIAIPYICEIDYVIPKGIYSISEIANLISNQINGIELPLFDNENFIQFQKLHSKFEGTIYNGTTCKKMRVNDLNFWSHWKANGTPPRAQIKLITGLQPTTVDYPVVKEELPDTVATTCAVNEVLRQDVITGNYDLATTNKTLTTIVQNDYSMGFEKVNGSDRSFNSNIYNLFHEDCMGMGTTGFNITFAEETSSFAVQNLHEPQRISTHDKYGNKLDNAGASCAFVKRINETAVGTLPVDKVAEAKNNIDTLVQRYTGISVYNWAYKTSKKFGIQDFSVKMTSNKDDAELVRKYATFEEQFNNVDDAKLAWNNTIWARLGFSYDDIQSKNSFESQRYFTQPEETVNGFTTQQEVDSSAVPFISTIFNGATGGYTAPAKPVKGAVVPSIAPPSAITNIQQFNTLDCNVPDFGFSNNKATAVEACVAPYQYSFYSNSVMMPIQTKGRDATASNLPVLSENGYLYILSDIIDPNDIVKFKDNVGLLDLLPKSNLSNQDFIADRTPIMHTLSNSRVLNTIKIQILNPDLTNVPLQPNSSVLLKITIPQEKQTELRASIENNMQEEVIEQQVQKEIKDLNKTKK
jgi:hypothetical protein